MKKAALGAFALAFSMALPMASRAAPESYTVDSTHTYAYFEVDHLGVSTQRGRFDRTSGKITMDRAAKTGSVELNIEAGSVSSGDNVKGSRPRTLDDHLKTADFFNAGEFPRVTFKSTGVKFAGDNPSEIAGSLTMLGVTKPVTLKVERWTCKDHPMNKKPMCGGNASGSVKRTDFGMKYGVPAIGDEVRLWFSVEAFKD
ncbi:MAG: polyisoprenoid-binding protein [Candidatus Parcubacteria bacterium]|nr:polyisoprenoid-binding protein [Burkholderiales bacterium]